MGKYFFVLIALAVVTLGVYQAQSEPSPATPAEPVNLKAGEEIVMKGTKLGATACMACHGVKGNENLTGAFPRLAGLPQMYLQSSLDAYASGLRKNDIMAPIAKAMSDEERRDVAAYYESMEPGKRKIGNKPFAGDVKRGELLAKIGDQKILVQACNNCHGPGGRGMGSAIPMLAGQFAGYLEIQLQSWKLGQRKTSPNQMLEITKRLSDKDIAALASYFDQVSTATAK